jgi:3'-phosphoadenosine 5'-phosphosulfate sulfotransferase (PAPS reductase)/FAD synthetase
MIDENRKKVLTVISLGAGVQSSTMALMAADGELPRPSCAIFADTGYEPKSVMRYLEFLKKVLPYPVYIVSKGNIRDDMIAARGTTDLL